MLGWAGSTGRLCGAKLVTNFKTLNDYYYH